MYQKPPKIAVAMSGGVDSLVSAFLLKVQGWEVFGVHFVTGYESRHDAAPCPDPIEAAAARMRPLADRVGIELAVIDIRAEFQRQVVEYFTRTYRGGETPNPCLVCNPVVKFGTVFTKARKLGAEKFATGHYARIDEHGRLLRGKDRTKDQSYFLAFLSQQQLAGAVFPLGARRKKDVVALAREKGLEPAGTESQDACFIKEGDYKQFLIRQPGFDPQPGPIVDLAGNQIGTHRGLFGFTVGQRRGINIPASEPYYVIRLEPDCNRLVVGHKKDLITDHCRVEAVRWPGAVPQGPFRAQTRVRYRHRAAASTVTPVGESAAVVRFDKPQSAVTPGQGAVFYDGEVVLGGGFISGD
ncbi:MAG: tRNA 2-thiouridine(34) synthase MnmA [Desulfobacterales bacterium]|jgi:tRNA-specific 2-thiouridylase